MKGLELMASPVAHADMVPAATPFGVRRPRLLTESRVRWLCLAALAAPLLVLTVLFGSALVQALPRLDFAFLSSLPSRFPEQAGVKTALFGSFYLMVLTFALAVPLGVGAAIYLEEFARPSRFTSFIELNIANLAGVPSIIYGLLGLEAFVRFADFGRSLLTGACTLSLLLLPMIIITAREALRTVPRELRDASLALGGTRWQTTSRVVVPACLPGIITGVILSLARAIGETAPLITIGALTYVATTPDSVMSPFTALPIQIFNWISRPQKGFHTNASAGIVVLLALLVTLNGAAILLRSRLRKKLGR